MTLKPPACSVVLCLLFGCGAGKALRPDDPTASAALAAPAAGGGAVCAVAPNEAEPLAVDWSPSEQVELAVAMQKGVALVAYDCKSLRVVKACHAAGEYTFTAVPSVLQETVQISDADEVKASLPFSGNTLSGDVSGNSAIDIALAYVGKRVTVNDTIAVSELVGADCGNATHFVRSASIGAFTMATGTKGQSKAAAEIFSFAAGGDSSSSKKRLNSAGDVASCKGIVAGAASPPDGCAAPLRLEIVKLSTTAGSGGVQEGAKPVPLASTCPDGFVPAEGGRCAKKSAAAGGYRCDPSDFDACKEQCTKGNAESCYNAALKLATGSELGGPREGAATPLFQEACRGKIGDACTWLGAIYFSGWPYLKYGHDAQLQAFDYWKKGCDLLSPGACYHEALSDEALDVAGRAAFFRRGCDLGDNASCLTYAEICLLGRGVPKNPSEGVRRYAALCDAGDKKGCEGLLDTYQNNAAVKDPAKAEAAKRRACARGVKLVGCGKSP